MPINANANTKQLHPDINHLDNKFWAGLAGSWSCPAKYDFDDLSQIIKSWLTQMSKNHQKSWFKNHHKSWFQRFAVILTKVQGGKHSFRRKHSGNVWDPDTSFFIKKHHFRPQFLRKNNAQWFRRLFPYAATAWPRKDSMWPRTAAYDGE